MMCGKVKPQSLFRCIFWCSVWCCDAVSSAPSLSDQTLSPRIFCFFSPGMPFCIFSGENIRRDYRSFHASEWEITERSASPMTSPAASESPSPLTSYKSERLACSYFAPSVFPFQKGHKRSKLLHDFGKESRRNDLLSLSLSVRCNCLLLWCRGNLLIRSIVQQRMRFQTLEKGSKLNGCLAGREKPERDWKWTICIPHVCWYTSHQSSWMTSDGK